jgi:putative transposase
MPVKTICLRRSIPPTAGIRKEGGEMNKYNPAIHHRRSIRLKGYDYSRPGAYFVTICVQEKDRPLFGKIIDGRMQLSHMGEIVWKCWNQLPRHYPNVRLDEFVVMPNHVHGIIWLVGPNGGGGVGARDDGARDDVGAGLQNRNIKDAKPARTAHEAHAGGGGIGGDEDFEGRIYPLSEVIRGFKTFSARRINELRGIAGVPVWQRNYYEHIVRNEEALQRIREYIVNNPVKWEWDRLKRN